MIVDAIITLLILLTHLMVLVDVTLVDVTLVDVTLVDATTTGVDSLQSLAME